MEDSHEGSVGGSKRGSLFASKRASVEEGSMGSVEQVDQDSIKMDEDSALFLTKSDQNTKSITSLIKSEATKGASEGGLTLSFGKMEARQFRKFMEVMQLESFFELKTQKRQHILSFRYRPHPENPGVDLDMLRFLDNFQICERSIEFPPQDFKVLEGDSKLRSIL